MKFPTQHIIAAVCATAALGGCVVAPYGYGTNPGHRGQGYATQPGAVYVAPTYALPAPGYAWQHHGRFGWGWRHPSHGWHRGWR
jgi:long-subunit fatty acid transport protein